VSGGAQTLTELLGTWGSARPGDVVAVERHGARRTLTIGDLVTRAEALAEGLAAAGASPDRPIVVWSPNRLEWIEAFAAAARLGVPVVGLNTRYRADELRHVLARSAAGVLVAVDEFAGVRFAEIVAEAGTGGLATIVILDTPGQAWRTLGCPTATWDSSVAKRQVVRRRDPATCSPRSPRPARPGSPSSPHTTKQGWSATVATTPPRSTSVQATGCSSTSRCAGSSASARCSPRSQDGRHPC